MRAGARRAGLTPWLRSARAKVNVPRKIRLNGMPIRLPEVLGMRCEHTEPWMYDLLRRLLPLKHGAFIDVGANVGQTLIKLKALDPPRTYIGFEPNPACVVYLTELIRENAFADCHIVPVGLFSEDGVSILNLYTDHLADDAASLIEKPHCEIHSRMFVPVFRFEAISNVLPMEDIGIVKIDAEVSELEVVRSMADLLAKDRPLVLLEILPVYTDMLKERQRELEKVIDELGYAKFRVAKTPELNLVGLQRIDEIPVHSDLSHCDYVLSPREASLTIG